MSDLISVIMSVYNTPEAWLRASIESILNQTYRDIEFIIVLDKPTDGSDEIVYSYAASDDRIIVIENTENMGLTVNLNRALAKASGKYIARMDSDDVSFRCRLEHQYKYMEENPYVAVLGTQVCTSFDRAHAMDIYPLCDWLPDQDLLKIRMLFHNVGVPHPTAMIRASVLRDNGITYDEKIRKSQDYKLWVDIMPYGSIMLLDEVLLMYRVHEGQITNNRSNQLSYAHMVSLGQAEALLGGLSDSEKETHCCIATDSVVPDIKSYRAYIRKLVSANDSAGKYDRKKFRLEIAYSWIQKASRRMKRQKKFDMILSSYMFYLLRPSFHKLLKLNKSLRSKRAAAVAAADLEREGAYYQ